ncbi:MAG TPA: bacteriohemerythrin, partial [Gallionella sp.]|nr:bacteriohemerythrin [Gallionella sp.]
GSKVLDVLKERDFFGEEGAIFKVPCLSHLRVLNETNVIQIPGELLKDVPILRWKLFESYQQRVTRVIYSGDPAEVFVWHDTFSTQVAQMDSHHKRLIEIGNAIMDHLHKDTDYNSLNKAFDALVDYTHYHFAAEEKLMALYNYPGTETHCKKHSDLFIQVAEYKKRMLGGDIPDKASFRHFFESWLVHHILDEDLKYGAFLNDRGVY